MEWFRTLATAAALLALFSLTEHARHRGLSSVVTRRLAHAVGAGAAATFPLYLQLRDVLLLSAAFAAFLAYTWLRGSLLSIHGVTRLSVGAPLFPLGLGLAALASWYHPGAFAFASLVLALADPAAAVVGQRLPRPGWRVAGGKKTAGGSLALFSVSLTLGTIFAAASGGPRLLATVVVSAVLTVIEGSLGYGLDNLLLPPAAAMLGQTLLGL